MVEINHRLSGYMLTGLQYTNKHSTQLNAVHNIIQYRIEFSTDYDTVHNIILYRI